jgi:hypothetical protein
LTFKDLKKRISKETTQQQETRSFESLMNKPFWIWNIEEHKKQDIGTNGDCCCFNHVIGLPIKDRIQRPIFDYQKLLYDALQIQGIVVTPVYCSLIIQWQTKTKSSTSSVRIVFGLNIIPIFFALIKAFFIDSISIANEGLVLSAQAFIIVSALERNAKLSTITSFSPLIILVVSLSQFP